MSQAQQVQLGLLVKLQDLEDLPPKLLGLMVHPKHQLLPIVGEHLVQELEVVALPPFPTRITKVLEPAKCSELVLRRFVGTSRTFFCFFSSFRFPWVFQVP